MLSKLIDIDYELIDYRTMEEESHKFQIIKPLRALFNLRKDTDEQGTVDAITNNTDFKSGNAWTLVFAIFIASVGLNINSTAVIIGAMLISPLMGPILGAGLALGINDFYLLKRSLRNLSFAMGISVLTSTLFFLVSPVSTAQAELLARTKPTVYDVLIAIFGGMAGIVAFSRKEKGNAIPGVAIATALMPPLCTAGFGLATGNLTYFIGAIYLFVINSVFICLATFIFVRYLHFHKVTQLDKAKEVRINRIMMFVAFAVFFPSVYLGWLFYTEEAFKARVQKFVTTEFSFPSTFVIQKDIKYEFSKQHISLTLVGEKLSDDKLLEIRNRLNNYHLGKAEVEINQSSTAGELERKFEDTLSKERSGLSEVQLRLQAAQNELSNYTKAFDLTRQLKNEIAPIFPTVSEIIVTSFGRSQLDRPNQLVLVKWKKRPTNTLRTSLVAFLHERLQNNDLEVWDVDTRK